MDLEQRLKLKEMLDSGFSILEVANALGVHRSAVYREIERGSAEGGYDPYYAQSLYEGRLKKKGRPKCKLSNKDLAEYISALILKEHLSPEKIVDLLARYNSRALLVFSLFCLHLPAKYRDTFLPSQQSLLFPEAKSALLLLHFPELSFGSSPICQ